MHYYKRNLGDYAKKAGRLSMLQHGAYTLLIDACYDREQFPTLEDAIEWTWASSTAEIEAVEFVLRKFFTLIDGVYVQKRIEEEIADYQNKSETNKRIAIERETKRKEKSTNRAQDVNDSTTKRHLTTNQEPLTTNQEEPNGSSHTVETANSSSMKTTSRFEEFWAAYPKKAGKKPAHDVWKRKRLDDRADDLIADVQLRAGSDRKWIGGFIPNASTYLSQERWNDEIERPAPTTATSSRTAGNAAAIAEARRRVMGDNTPVMEVVA